MITLLLGGVAELAWAMADPRVHVDNQGIIQVEPGLPEEQIEQLHVLARRFHLLPTRMDYAKALWLNGRMAEAEHELQIIRGVHHPAKFALIERDWRAWKEEHRGDATPHPPESPTAPTFSPPSRSTRP